MEWNDYEVWEQVSVVLVHMMLLGQTVFLVLWATLPWWRSWVGRALMIKSFALWLLLTFALVKFWWALIRGGWPLDGQLGSMIHVIVVVGIWSQVVALAHERRIASRGRRHITGYRQTSAANAGEGERV